MGVTGRDLAPCSGGMSKKIIGGGLSLLLMLLASGGCEQEHDPCDTERPDYTPLKCIFTEDKRPVCTGEEAPWTDCKKSVYSARELGLELGIETGDAAALLESEGYPPEEEGPANRYWLDAQALQSLAELSATSTQ